MNENLRKILKNGSFGPKITQIFTHFVILIFSMKNADLLLDG